MTEKNSEIEDIDISDFNFDFSKHKESFIEPKRNSKQYSIDEEIYKKANKIGSWIIVFFLAYHALNLLNIFLKMIIETYTPVEIIIPQYYIAIVSSIIGFYFGQRYSKDK